MCRLWEMKERAHNLKFPQTGEGKSKSGPLLTSLCPKEKVCAKSLKTQLTETTTHRKGLAAWALPGQSPAETKMDHSLTDPQPHNAAFQMSGMQCRMTQPGENSDQMEKGGQEKPVLRLAQMLCFSGRHQSSCYKDVWQTKEEDTLKQVNNGILYILLPAYAWEKDI